MKTIIIAGTYKDTPEGIIYNVVIYGQTPESPQVQAVTWVHEKMLSYDHLEEKCRNLYAKYFNTDLFNIISLVNLNYAATLTEPTN